MFSPYFNAGYLYFLLAFVVVGIAVHGKRFSQIDNFTHWATVVKNILSTNRFPTVQDTAIQFPTYPLGSAALIYWICREAGQTEHMQMWAQAFLMLSAILPVFACCRKNQSFYAVLIAVLTGFLLHYNIPLTELLVDTLMPLAGMATALFICWHCTEFGDGTGHVPYYAIPMLVWTMNIKHAALIYVLLAIVLLFLLYIRNNNNGKKHCFVVAGTVMFTRMVWSRHCSYVFEDVLHSKHSMSMDWFSSILGGKTKESIVFSIKKVIVHGVMRTEYLWMLVWILILGILVWRLKNSVDGKTYLAFLLSGIVLYGVYFVGVIAMYVFSMPEYELMAAFSRYMRSVDIAMYYMLMLFTGMLLGRISSLKIVGAVSIVMSILTLAGWYWQTGQYVSEELLCVSKSERQKLEQPIEDYGIHTRKSYLLCLEQKYESYDPFPNNIWKYRMETGAVEQIVVTDKAQLENAPKYDYVIIFDEGNPIIEEWLQENHPDQIGRSVIEQFA